MAFLINHDCLCCRNYLHHCKKCWNKFHNGENDNDYVQPLFYGESMMDEEIKIKMKNELGIELKTNIKEDKRRLYKEGEYNH